MLSFSGHIKGSLTFHKCCLTIIIGNLLLAVSLSKNTVNGSEKGQTYVLHLDFSNYYVIPRKFFLSEISNSAA